MSDTSRRPTVLLLAGLWIAASALAATDQPKVVVDNPIHDFGQVARGEKVEHTFSIENQGSAPLEIREIQAPCACTVPSDLEVVAPGAKVPFRVELDTANLIGPTSRRVHLYTNDTAAPRLDLTLKVDVKPWVSAKPGYVRYIVVQGFDAEQRDPTIRQTLWTEKGEEFAIEGVRSDYPGISVDFRKAGPEERDPELAGPQWLVETRIAPDAPVGPITGYVHVDLEHPEQPLLTIPISGFVRPVFALTPASVAFGEVAFEDGEPIGGSVKVQNFATEPIPVTRVEETIEGLSAEIKSEQEGRLYYLELTLDPSMPKGAFSGTIKLYTDSPRAPVLELPVAGTIK